MNNLNIYTILTFLIQNEITQRRENNKRLKLLAKFHTFAQISKSRRRAYLLDVDSSEIPSWTISTIKKWTRWFVNFNKPDFVHQSVGAMAYNHSLNKISWCKENLSTIQSELIGSGINWLQNQELPPDAVIPPNLILDNEFHYLNKNANVGYVADFSVTSYGYPTLKLIFNDFKNPAIAFSSKDIIDELFENSTSIGNPSPRPKSLYPPRAITTTPSKNKEKKEQFKSKILKKEIEDFEHLVFDGGKYYIDPQDGTEHNWYLNDVKGLDKLIDQISESGLSDIDIRYCTNEKLGEYAAILLQDINRNKRGLQRFHKKLFHDKNKSFSYGLKKNGSFFIIGEITFKTEKAAFCEGFADGIVLAAELDIPVVVCLDSGNLTHVISDFARNFPNLKGIIFSDNDQWKYDRANNVGVLKAIEACRMANAILGKDNYRFVVPKFDEWMLKSKPTDVWNLWKLSDGKAYFHEIASKARIPPSGYEWQLERLGYIGIKAKQNKPLDDYYKAIVAVIESGIELTPTRPFTEIKNEVLEAIKKQSKRFEGLECYKETDVLAYVEKRLTTSYRSVIEGSVKFVSDELLSDCERAGVKVVKHDMEIDEKGLLSIPKHISESIVEADSGLHIVIEPKGAGKSSKIIKPCVDKSRQENGVPTGTAPFTLLIDDLSQKMRIGNYQDINSGKEAQKQDSLGYCINSELKAVYQGIFAQSRFFFVDEIDAVYDAITVGTVPDSLRKPIFDRLQQKIGGTQKVVVASADIDDLCLSLLLKTRPANEITIYIANPSPVLKGKVFNIHNSDKHLKQLAINTTIAGEKTFICGDNVLSIESTGKRLDEAKIAHKTITSNNSKTNDSHEFVENINEVVKDYQSVCVTTVMSTGVSIECEHFNAVYGTYSGEASINTFAQTISRPRCVKEFHIAPAKNIDRVNVQREIEDSKRQKLAAAVKTKEITGKYDFVTSVEITDEFTDFDFALINTIAKKKDERNFNTFLRQLLAQGGELRYINHDIELIKESTLISNEEIKDLKQAKVDEILEADELLEPLSPVEIKEMAESAMQKAVTSTQEKAAILRVRYEQRPNEDIVKFEQKGGSAKIARLEKALLDPNQAVLLDAKELDNLPITLLKHNWIKQTFDGLLLDAIGLSPEIFDSNSSIQNSYISFSGKDECLNKLTNRVTPYKDAFNGANIGVTFTDKTQAEPIKFVKAWCGKLGVKLIAKQGRQGRHYQVDGEWLNVIKIPIQRNLENGVNKFSNEIEKKYGGIEIPIEIYENEHSPMANEQNGENHENTPLINSVDVDANTSAKIYKNNGQCVGIKCASEFINESKRTAEFISEPELSTSTIINKLLSNFEDTKIGEIQYFSGDKMAVNFGGVENLYDACETLYEGQYVTEYNGVILPLHINPKLLFENCFSTKDIATVIDKFETAPDSLAEKVVEFAKERSLVLRAAKILS